jgi:methionyl-tRNA formyltransferase
MMGIMNTLERKTLPARPRIVFFGTPAFAVPALEALVRKGHEIRAVVTQPDRPKGRGRRLTAPPVKQQAGLAGLVVLQPEKASDSAFCDLLRSFEPDLFLVIAFGQILKKAVLEVPTWGALNVHASLLPRYRGAAPIHWAVLNNEPMTGLTAMQMDEGLDTGPILHQEEIRIIENETAGELHDRLAEMAGKFVVRTLEALTRGRLEARPQDDRLASYAPKIDRGMARVDWRLPAMKISAFIRALDPWPGATTTLSGKQIKLFSARVVHEGEKSGSPGRVARKTESAFQVETGNGLVEIGALQLPGRKRLPAADFMKGFPVEEGTLLGQG